MNNQSVTQPEPCNEARLYLGMASVALAVCATALWCALLCAWADLVKFGQSDLEQTTAENFVSQTNPIAKGVA